MGKYYALGIVKKFKAKSNHALTQVAWEQYLNERLDLARYTLKFGDDVVEGKLNQNIFKENIEDLYDKLFQIISNDLVSAYFEYKGTDIEQYQTWMTGMSIKDYNPSINLSAELAILFIEGKVFVEEFTIEPKLMNWLFRHVDLSNPLSGCIMTDVVG